MGSIESSVLPLWARQADKALSGWGLGSAKAKLISLSENATYLVEPTGSHKYVLRLHRPGFRTEAQIKSEIAWLDDLSRYDDVSIASAVPSASGSQLFSFEGPSGTQHAVLFHFLDGKEPESVGLSGTMSLVGKVAARLHVHASQWQRPTWFDRFEWDPERIFGSECDYGDWRETREVGRAERNALEWAEFKVRRELEEYGRGAGSFGLIHTDLRSSNLLVDESGSVSVLDFDDCGIGWFAYDVACSFAFHEGDKNLPFLVAEYLRGYRSAGGVLAARDVRIIPTMLMARALQLVAWMECRSETKTSHSLRHEYVPSVTRAAQLYTDGCYLPEIAAAASLKESA